MKIILIISLTSFILLNHSIYAEDLKIEELYDKAQKCEYVKSGMKISNRQKELIDIINRTPNISIKDMADNLKINISAVQKHVDKLKEKGLLKRVGPDKGGYWKVIKK